LWPVRPDRMEPVPDRDSYLKGWVYTAPDGREKIPLLPHEVIYNKYPNPLDVYGGLGPVQTVLTEVEASRYAGEWNRNYFANSAEPGGVIQVDHNLDDDEFDDLVERWRESHQGVSRAHRIAVLEGGQTWVPNSHSQRDMDFVNLRSDSRDAIREALGMHKVMTGVTDDVNRANAQTGEEVFANWKVVPRLDRWRDVLNFQFLPLFGSTGTDVEFDYIYPLPANREQDNAELTAKSAAALSLIQAGYDPHDVLEVVGLPDMDMAGQGAGDAPPAEGPEGAPAPAQAWAPFALSDGRFKKVNGHSLVVEAR
jgi:HK97 family phage portal protein